MSRNSWLPFTLSANADPVAASPADAAYAEAVRLLTTDDDDGDPNAAAAILEGLAKDGHREGQLLLGRLLLGYADRAREGIAWLRRAAEAGAWDAYYTLGLAAFRGVGQAADAEEARALHRVAAEHDVADAQFELSLLMDLGLGGPPDPIEAERWETRAAEAGQSRACFNRGSRLARRDPPELGDAIRWYTRAADAGNADAASRLCRMYLRGEGAPRDEAIARRWFERAAALGYDWKSSGA